LASADEGEVLLVEPIGDSIEAFAVSWYEDEAKIWVLCLGDFVGFERGGFFAIHG
jgi:hypothetical protein